MQIPKTAEYARRVMAHIARLPEGRAARAQELSRAADIPTPYLSKVLRKLVVAGLLKSQKGHGGGFVLARPAKRIRFIDVLGATDFDLGASGCAFGWERCDSRRPCPLHPAWSALKESWMEWAATHTLAEVQEAPAHPRERESLAEAFEPPLEPPTSTRR